MNLSIRTLSSVDAEALLAVEAQAQNAMTPAQLREALADVEVAVLGSYRGETLVGYAMVAKQPFDAELQAIGVLPGERGCGVGSALMQAVVWEACQWQSERLLLEVRAGNQTAIALYQRMGFKQDGRRKGYYPSVPKEHIRLQNVRPEAQGATGREDALLMSRVLTP
ncbi:ribosomal protein S18-alanine N-acetyltransferase [Halomonas vilamensis]|uniref:Ribosomal protein S18-alanine N-acetyltransferase n=1 Tax=Vreelandella vilamensis TaxID=531309 RepID=A0ABU1H0E9_9GAMM|nr:ribosomal protein S18-alanine N-acetyltransferase [Halomonas vilamensis]MDR5897784.1 ribosomal protein S18-alanine N-acetyltransferase [Halomonas vilamensis]